MGTNVAAMLILALLLTVIALTSRASIISDTLLELASRAAWEREEEQGKTSFTINSTSGSGTSLTVTAKNIGTVAVAEFTKMDFIVKYVSTAGGGTTVIARLTYTEGTLAADQWKWTSISPDNVEKNIWNRNETVTLSALLSGTLDSATNGTVTLVTPNGVAVTSFFTVP